MSLQRDPERNYEEQLGDVMHAVISSLRAYDGSQNYWLRNYPHESCFVTSTIVGSLLLDLGYETYGRWFLVSRFVDRERDPVYDASHVWLELRDSDGTVIYTIDATSDQFPKWETEPFVVYGPSPLGVHFPTIIFETPMRDFDVDSKGELFTGPLAHVRSVLGSRGG